MTAARFEYLDMVASKDNARSLEQAKAAAYQQGVTDGREQVEAEKQDKLENAFVAGIVATLAVVGTCWFVASL